MAGGGWLFVVVVLLSLASTMLHKIETIKTHQVSVGHLFVVKCKIISTNVTWSREGAPNQSLPAGVEARDALLWFLPVQMAHNGTYTCEKKDDSKIKMKFRVLVSREQCPEPVETRTIAQGDNGRLPCKQYEIFQLSNTRDVRWMKDCHLVDRGEETVSVNEKGIMTLSEASESDAGNYTCLVNVILDGRRYTAARSIQLVIEKGLPNTVFTLIQMVYPQKDVVIVEVGMRAELKCLAHVGFTEDNEVLMYWTFNSDHIGDYREFNDSWRFVHEKGQVKSESTLSISQVRREFLNIPFRCFVVSPAEKKSGLLYLQEADRSSLNITVGLCLSAILTALVAGISFLFCRTDLLLAYRNLSGHFTEKTAPDGKLYDAYVSYLHPNNRSTEMAAFALQLLPEKLERQHGYSLYIRGRDDSPGEATHDIIATTVRQCQRVIVILSAEEDVSAPEEDEREIFYSRNQHCYEQSISLYDALLLNDPRVILVEIGLMDYSDLPESLRYIKRKQGALTWRKSRPGAHSLKKMYLNRNFWKNLRYNMPAVRVRKLQMDI